MPRFVSKMGERRNLTVDELASAESYWISLAQQDLLSEEIQELKAEGTVGSTSSLFSDHPLLDAD